MTQKLLRSGSVVLLAMFLIVSMAAAPGMAQINNDADAAPNVEYNGNVTISGYEMGWDGLQYSNNNGDVVDFPGQVDPARDNPYSFVASDINFSDAEAFPHSDGAISAINSSRWTVSGANASKVSTSDVETAPGKAALRVSTDGTMAAGDDATATFSDVSITSDENKRYLQIIGDVNTLAAGATVEIRAVDAGGDYYAATIDPSATSGPETMATATGEGFVFQEQLGNMTLVADGDGTFDDIQTVEINVTDGDAEIDIAALNVDKTSPWALGEEKVDNDADDALETVAIEDVESGGAISIHSLDSMGTTFDSARIEGLTVDFQQTADHLDSEDVSTEFTAADAYPNFENKLDAHFRFKVPDEYDLSYADLEVADQVAVPGSRYETVEYATGTGDTAFDDIDSWTAVTSSYDSLGTNVTITSTPSAGENVDLHFVYPVTSDEKSALENLGGSATGPIEDEGPSGPLDYLFSLPGMIVTVIVSYAGLARAGLFGGG